MDNWGNEVAAASTVAPNTSPDMPSPPKNAWPLDSSVTPATSVARAATPNTNAALRVEVPRLVARASLTRWA